MKFFLILILASSFTFKSDDEYMLSNSYHKAFLKSLVEDSDDKLFVNFYKKNIIIGGLITTDTTLTYNIDNYSFSFVNTKYYNKPIDITFWKLIQIDSNTIKMKYYSDSPLGSCDGTIIFSINSERILKNNYGCAHY